MENQHRKISGYRELSQAEIDLMNRFKEVEADLLALIEYVSGSRGQGVLTASQEAESARCAAIAKTNLQQGFMWAVRSVALPGVE